MRQPNPGVFEHRPARRMIADPIRTHGWQKRHAGRKKPAHRGPRRRLSRALHTEPGQTPACGLRLSADACVHSDRHNRNCWSAVTPEPQWEQVGLLCGAASSTRETPWGNDWRPTTRGFGKAARKWPVRLRSGSQRTQSAVGRSVPLELTRFRGPDPWKGRRPRCRSHTRPIRLSSAGR